jgi:RNA polymerase sigma factor (TIGR02999 family)
MTTFSWRFPGAVMAGEDGDITALLQRWKDGSVEAENELFRAVMPELQKLARYFMQRERDDHSLHSSDLIHQVYFKLVGAKNRDWQNRRHFFALAARAMRRFLIDYARNRGKRRFVPLPDVEAALAMDVSKADLALTIDKLLHELETTQPDLCSVVELKFFVGLTDEEAASALGLKLRTFQRMWQDARQWMFSRF